MEGILQAKLEELKNQLAEQKFSAEVEAEIEKQVVEYKKNLVEEVQREFDNNKALINAKIELIEDLIEAENKAKAEEEKARLENSVSPETTPNLL